MDDRGHISYLNEKQVAVQITTVFYFYTVNTIQILMCSI